MTWLADIFLIFVFYLILVLSWFIVTFVGAIRGHITLLDIKRLPVYFIIIDTEAPLSAKKFINVALVQNLLIADHQFE